MIIISVGRGMSYRISMRARTRQIVYYRIRGTVGHSCILLNHPHPRCTASLYVHGRF